MRQRRFESESTGPATLGSTARAHLVLFVRCRGCGHRVNVDAGEQAERHGADLPVPDWAARLSCSRCGGRNVDFVVTPASTGGAGR